MLSLIVLIAGGLLTSLSAVSDSPWSATRNHPRRFEDFSLLQACAGSVALGAIFLSVHVQLGIRP
jgi:hypothetical protein